MTVQGVYKKAILAKALIRMHFVHGCAFVLFDCVSVDQGLLLNSAVLWVDIRVLCCRRISQWLLIWSKDCTEMISVEAWIGTKWIPLLLSSIIGKKHRLSSKFVFLMDVFHVLSSGGVLFLVCTLILVHPASFSLVLSFLVCGNCFKQLNLVMFVMAYQVSDRCGESKESM